MEIIVAALGLLTALVGLLKVLLEGRRDGDKE